jgi:hypothetical protein
MDLGIFLGCVFLSRKAFRKEKKVNVSGIEKQHDAQEGKEKLLEVPPV